MSLQPPLDFVLRGRRGDYGHPTQHIETLRISPCLRSSKSVGDNIFIAEFGSKQDLERALDGSPWNVGKKAVLLQHFDPNLRPSEVTFNKIAIWIRIYDLPFGLMNRKWGWELA